MKHKLKYIILFVSIMVTNTLQAQTRIEGLHYITGKPVSIEVRNGKIGKITPIKKLSNDKHPIYVAPGLLDNQVNGFAGISFGFAGSQLDRAGIIKATQELWKKGVTSYLPTLTTNSQELLINNLSIFAKTVNEPFLHGSIPGYHLEGPYISPADGFRGAHPLKYVRKPNWEEFTQLNNAAGGKILTITIAPEIDGAIDFIRQCSSAGIIVSLGHHNASKATIDLAAQNGAKTCTHLGNGCANMINRHDNPLWPQLANDKLMASLICDGFHLRDEEIITFFKVKGIEKTIITSDVTSYAGLPPGEYKNNDGETIELTKEGMLRYPAQNVLYGSASPISIGVVHMMQVTGCSLAEAIQMASTNPAALYNLKDRGSIEPGKRADLILFTIGEKELHIEKTYVEGYLVYDALAQ